LNAGTHARVGEPLTLTLHLKAVGLGFEQLPELNLPKIDGAEIYPDKATTQNRDAGDVISGERERKFAIVPNRSGNLTIPSIGIAWWDVVHDRPETASVPEVSLDVEATSGTAAEPSPVAPVSKPAANPQSEAPIAPTVSSSSDDARLWRLLAIATSVLWLVTVVIAAVVWRRRAPRTRPPTADIRALPDNVSTKAQFRSACLNGDWTAAANALIAWANARGARARNLGELAAALAETPQVAAIDDLQRVLYAGAPAANLASVLSAAFKDGPRLVNDRSHARRNPALPPLYPTQLDKRA
jgi:hypothetical protein